MTTLIEQVARRLHGQDPTRQPWARMTPTHREHFTDLVRFVLTVGSQDAPRTGTVGHYVLDVLWDVPDLPRFIGPFATDQEATEWASLNVPNGTWTLVPLAYPYSRSSAASA